MPALIDALNIRLKRHIRGAGRLQWTKKPEGCETARSHRIAYRIASERPDEPICQAELVVIPVRYLLKAGEPLCLHDVYGVCSVRGVRNNTYHLEG